MRRHSLYQARYVRPWMFVLAGSFTCSLGAEPQLAMIEPEVEATSYYQSPPSLRGNLPLLLRLAENVQDPRHVAAEMDLARMGPQSASLMVQEIRGRRNCGWHHHPNPSVPMRVLAKQSELGIEAMIDELGRPGASDADDPKFLCSTVQVIGMSGTRDHSLFLKDVINKYGLPDRAGGPSCEFHVGSLALGSLFREEDPRLFPYLTRLSESAEDTYLAGQIVQYLATRGVRGFRVDIGGLACSTHDASFFLTAVILDPQAGISLLAKAWPELAPRERREVLARLSLADTLDVVPFLIKQAAWDTLERVTFQCLPNQRKAWEEWWRSNTTTSRSELLEKRLQVYRTTATTASAGLSNILAAGDPVVARIGGEWFLEDAAWAQELLTALSRLPRARYKPAAKLRVFLAAAPEDSRRLGDILRLLGVVGDESDVVVLRRYLAHRDATARFEAAVALLKLGDTSGVDKLIDAIPRSRGHAASLLERHFQVFLGHDFRWTDLSPKGQEAYFMRLQTDWLAWWGANQDRAVPLTGRLLDQVGAYGGH